MNETERYDRQVRFFGADGQQTLQGCHVVVVGIGGLGTHVVQQLAHLGVGHLTLIDNEELSESNLNRYVGARHTDPIPGTRKVDIGRRIVHDVNPRANVDVVHDTLMSVFAFDAVVHADYVFGCLDNEGARLILNELCAAYARRYIDLATGIIPGHPPNYGGRVFCAWDGNGCMVCTGELNLTEAQEDLMEPAVKRDRDAIYGVSQAVLDRIGPSVVSLNGVVASLAVTEFVVWATGLRNPQRLVTYRGHMGIVSRADLSEVDVSECYFCKSVYGQREKAEVYRHVKDRR